jgi:hypothetical protein
VHWRERSYSENILVISVAYINDMGYEINVANFFKFIPVRKLAPKENQHRPCHSPGG